MRCRKNMFIVATNEQFIPMTDDLKQGNDLVKHADVIIRSLVLSKSCARLNNSFPRFTKSWPCCTNLFP